MKATFDVPDELYRRAKARSALEGRPLRTVVLELFEGWLSSERPARPRATVRNAGNRFDNAPWVKLARKHVKPGASHDLDQLRAAAARGWAAESK